MYLNHSFRKKFPAMCVNIKATSVEHKKHKYNTCAVILSLSRLVIWRRWERLIQNSKNCSRARSEPRTPLFPLVFDPFYFIHSYIICVCLYEIVCVYGLDLFVNVARYVMNLIVVDLKLSYTIWVFAKLSVFNVCLYQIDDKK